MRALDTGERTLLIEMSACGGALFRYETRLGNRDGAARIEKAKHVLDMLIELERKKAPA
jgi:hypothetical protein